MAPIVTDAGEVHSLRPLASHDHRCHKSLVRPTSSGARMAWLLWQGAFPMTNTLDTLTAADVERQKLQRHFGRFDILFFLICTIVGVDTIASVAKGGGQAFSWLAILAVAFFVPQALLFSELGTAFPQEGGEYLWTRLAFGHLVGAVNNFLYWITNPVWIGGTLAGACVGAIAVFFNNGNQLSTLMFYVVALLFVWVSVLAA